MPHFAFDQSPAWGKLNQHSKNRLDLNALFVQDKKRFSNFSYNAPFLFADFSKQHITEGICAALLELAHECNLETKRDAMFAGEKINISENRQVLHTALRGTPDSPYYNEIESTRQQFLQFAQTVRDTSEITDIVNIGIGGSDLGPKLGIQALTPYIETEKRFHFVSNVDGFELASVLKQLKPESTLFVVVSKSFSTQETMLNAQTAKTWFENAGDSKTRSDIAKHFIGITTNTEAAKEFGIEKTFTFWDWVGGRYSVWSAVGLTLAIAIGPEHFLAFLEGAQKMDMHFKNTPLEKNVPVLMGLIDVWNRNFLNRPSRCIAPYHQGLANFPCYLQQLEMESNGKSVTQDGKNLSYSTSPVVWGEVGSNCQHTFFQMLHQGTDVVPVDFILVKQAIYPANQLLPAESFNKITEQHQVLLMNALAQSRALMIGQTREKAESGSLHCYFPGNRPSSSIVLEKLDPASLGALIALHEHRVFTSGAIWGINSFDQWGVELGKNIAKELLNSQSSVNAALDTSTAGLLQYLNKT